MGRGHVRPFHKGRRQPLAAFQLVEGVVHHQVGSGYLVGSTCPGIDADFVAFVKPRGIACGGDAGQVVNRGAHGDVLRLGLRLHLRVVAAYEHNSLFLHTC